MPKTIYLLDGHALAYRAFFALMAAGARFRTSSGEPTAGIYGFANILLRIIEEEKPQYLAVAFDTGKTFRNEMFAGYKATRAKMPDDLVPQIERIRELVDAFNIPRLEIEGYEADDVLGSVAKIAEKEGFTVKIITGDRDLLQLVNERIIVNLAGGKLSEAKDYFREDVKNSFGVFPEQVVDYKALVGDPSDNIPGVKGIGQKTTENLLAEYSTLDDIYEHLDQLKGRTRNLLEENKKNAYLSYRLAKIHTDLDIPIDFERARIDNANPNKVLSLFRELEFRSLTSRIEQIAGVASIPSASGNGQPSLFSNAPDNLVIIPTYEVNAVTVDTDAKLMELKHELGRIDAFAFDTETTSVDPMLASMVGMSISFQKGKGYYIPLNHRTGEKQLAQAQVFSELGSFFKDNSVKKYGHNIKYDLLVLKNQGLQVEGVQFDSMIAAWLIEPDSRRLGLKDLAETELGIKMTHIEELIGSGSKQRSMDEIQIGNVCPYAVADAEVVFSLYEKLMRKLKERNVDSVFEKIEMPLVPVLTEMEFQGIAVDVPFFKQFSQDLSRRMLEIEQRIRDILGYAINVNSTQQLSKALFESLDLQPPDNSRKTKSGHYSTAASVLEEMRGQHEMIDAVLEYRELAKLVSTYLDALPQQVNPHTNRMHTSFNQTGSSTGRLASSNPNLQNIPTRTELGHKVRRGFVAGEGMLFLSVDYSQIELRIVAHMAEDKAMLDAFRAGQDIHAATAAAIYDIPIGDVTSEQRRHAKAINFGLIYGMSAFGLSRSADLTLAEAENFVKAYFDRFPKVKKYLDGIRKDAARQGYVETLLHRRRYFLNLKSPATHQIRAREEREAMNAPIQGTAADIIKIAMIQLPHALQSAGLGAKLLLQVHDELLLECPEEELNETAIVVQGIMENAHALSIPLTTDAKFGKNWGEMEALTDK